MYGTIPGGLRSRYHGLYQGLNDFNQMLNDVFSVVIPQLTIMDGIMAMEGQGPAAGKLRNLGMILSSRDAVALDAVATGITGLNPSSVNTIRFAAERGLGTGDIARIEVCGEEMDHIKVNDFKYPVVLPGALLKKIPAFLLRYILNNVALKPYIRTQKCTGCRECEKICPAGAALVVNGKAGINRDLCIQCMCCHEVCRFDAVEVKRSTLGNAIYFLVDLARFIVRPLRR
jgi:TPP-dependent indolepyruvate ferredoxin oxidoreductase alpha subunit